MAANNMYSLTTLIKRYVNHTNLPASNPLILDDVELFA
jgi:hypothetical protein